MEQKSSRKEEKNLDINGRLLRGLLVISDKNRRARLSQPCPGRSRKYCTNECEWKLGWVWGTCKVADVFAFYVAELCDGDLLEASSAKKVRDFAKSIGYLSKDFNERALRDVSKAEICRKISNDVETIREKIRDTLESKAPWNELGIDKNDYVEIRSQVVEDMKAGYSMKRLLDDAKKYATQENLVRAAKTAALVGTIVGVGLALGWAAGGEDAYDRGPPGAHPGPVGLHDPGFGFNLHRAAPQVTQMDPYKFGDPGVYKPSFPIVPDWGQPVEKRNTILDQFKYVNDADVLKGVTESSFNFATNVDDLRQIENSLESSEMCYAGLELEADYLKAAIRGFAMFTGNVAESTDFKKWCLLPGQQIYYGGAFGRQEVTHHAIYVGDGVVIEVGSGPQMCKKFSRNLIQFKDHMVGLSSLVYFAERAVINDSPIYVVNTPMDIDKPTILERLERALEIAGCWDYNIVADNCEAAANYISFGVRASLQTANMIKLAITGSALATLIQKWRKNKRQGIITAARAKARAPSAVGDPFGEDGGKKRLSKKKGGNFGGAETRKNCFRCKQEF